MCGRYTLHSEKEVLALRFRVDVEGLNELEPRYNIAPTQQVPVVRIRDGAREAELMRWGLVPHWAESVEQAGKLINARSESAATRAPFRDAFRRARCLIPADGFYEWQRPREGNRKIPHWISLASGEPFAMAGLWAAWRERDLFGDRWLLSCAILTTRANEAIAPLHDRMPVILHPEAEDPWLDPALDGDVERLRGLLVPVPPEALQSHPVSTRVNSVRNQGPDLIGSAPRAGF